MKPVIGVMPLWDAEKDSIWMLPGYLDGILEASGVPLMFPLTEDGAVLEQLMNLVDGVLFTGGQDVSPELYGEQPLNEGVICCPARDGMEKTVLDLALKQDKTVLGICRGIQFINAALGGTLYQDLPIQHPSDTVHRQSAPYDRPSHTVAVAEQSPLFELLQKNTLAVNSCHHQAIRTLAPGPRTMAVSEDGLIEAVCLPGKRFFWAVQWHPEFAHLTEADQRKILEAFVQAAKGK